MQTKSIDGCSDEFSATIACNNSLPRNSSNMINCSTCNDEYPVTTIIIVAVLGGLIAIGLIIVVLRIVRKKDSRDEIRKLYSIDVEADHYMNDDLDVALIEAPAVRTDGVISTVTTNAFSEKSVLYTRTLQDYETSDEET